MLGLAAVSLATEAGSWFGEFSRAHADLTKSALLKTTLLIKVRGPGSSQPFLTDGRSFLSFDRGNLAHRARRGGKAMDRDRQ